jgi:hypothetical protein
MRWGTEGDDENAVDGSRGRAAAWVGLAMAADTASGSFTSHTVVMPVQTALAFRGKSVLDKQDVIVVGVTNAKMHPEAMVNYYDRAARSIAASTIATRRWSTSSSARTANTRATRSTSPRQRVRLIAAATWGSRRR